MLAFPNAKINIGLFVTDKRTDGYHNIETVFYAVQLKDALEIIDSVEMDTTICLSGLPVSGNPNQNLVWRAYQLLRNDFPDKVKPVSIFLHKVIPMGAGMGGGSADGTFMLTMINEHFNLQLSEHKLIEYALQLGSDCPFFIANRPSFAKGRGELLQALPGIDLSNYTIQIICPELHVSTATAFSSIKPQAAPFDLRLLPEIEVGDWTKYIYNDFEKSVFKKHPELRSIKEQLYGQGAVYAAMSGTGASVYGIFQKGRQAKIEADVAFKEYFN